MHIETPKKTIAKSGQEVFDFLSDIKNFETLMPENIDTFELLDENTFSFALKGMPVIGLRLKEKLPHTKIVLEAASGKLPFTLTADIDEIDDRTSEVLLSFKGEFNAMMAMMVKGPITNFMGTLSSNLEHMD